MSTYILKILFSHNLYITKSDSVLVVPNTKSPSIFILSAAISACFTIKHIKPGPLVILLGPTAFKIVRHHRAHYIVLFSAVNFFNCYSCHISTSFAVQQHTTKVFISPENCFIVFLLETPLLLQHQDVRRHHTIHLLQAIFHRNTTTQLSTVL